MTIRETKELVSFAKIRLKNICKTIKTIKELRLDISIFSIFRLDLILPYLYFKYYKLKKLERSRDEISFIINNLKGVK